MSKLSAEDEAQLEYIRQWYEMKEEKKRAKAIRKMCRQYDVRLAKVHFKYAMYNIAKSVRLLLGKRD